LTIYADTSFFVSLYVKDIHSITADEMLRGSERPPITPLHIAEWTHAIAQQVFRRQMTMVEAGRLHRDFDDDCAAQIWQTLLVPETALEVCADLGRRFGPKLGVRTLDSLHVACALELKTKRFWTFDERQRKLAKAAGLDIR
jgi:predicted nucleic acid-binding protein